MGRTRHSERAEPEGPGRVCLVVSRYNDRVTSALRRGAERAYAARGGDAGTLGVVEVPGAFELVAAASAAVESRLFDGVVALGCVIRGETDHDRYIAQAVADGLAGIAAVSGVPVAFGVLTVNSPEQAEARAGGAKGNKGEEAMLATLDTIGAVRALAAGRSDRTRPVRYELAAAADKTATAGA